MDQQAFTQICTLLGAVLSAQWAFGRYTLRALERVIQAQEQTLQQRMVAVECAVQCNAEAMSELREALRELSMVIALRSGSPTLEPSAFRNKEELK